MSLRRVLYFFLLLTAAAGKSIKQDDEKVPYELDEFLQGTFSTRSFNGSWITGNTFIYTNTDGDITTFDLSTKSSTPFLSRSILNDYPGASIAVSPDQLYVLIRYSVNAVFRHSTTAIYAVYDVQNNQFYDIAEKNHIQVAQWSPVGHGLIYVYLNNVYYLQNPSSSPLAVTTDGVEGVIYNGVPDWVYEEEVLGSGSALWFSPNGKEIVFAAFDDTEVREFTYTIYGSPGDLKDQYPQEVTIRYPKVNTNNPVVTIYMASLEPAEDKIEVNLNLARFLPAGTILYDVTWITNEEFAMILTNRVQNEATLYRCNIQGECESEATYKETEGWLDARIPKYNNDGTQRLEILPQPEDDDHFDHLVLTTVATGNAVRLTEGRFMVLNIYGWDQAKNVVYFLGTVANDPTQQHVYVVNIASGELKCLSCETLTDEGQCKYASASFSKDLSYYVQICQGPGPYLVELHNTGDELDIVVWQDNQNLRNLLATKLQPKIKELKVEVANGFQANVRLLLPPNLDESSSKKYPAVVYVYAGPDSNQITNAYSAGFQNYIVTNREYIYILIDGRGSGRDGQRKKFQVYRNLATVEIEDQINVTRYLQETLPYIDASNTGIWGWSYGGFATAWALVKDKANVFKFGLSVAPVTSFIYYDSIYTERYMGLATEDDNLAGYNNTDVTRNVEALRGKLFFLIHGNADDNVHYQQSMLLSKALEYADIPFRQQSYPDQNHGLGYVYPHLYHNIDQFWAESITSTETSENTSSAVNTEESAAPSTGESATPTTEKSTAPGTEKSKVLTLMILVFFIKLAC